MKNYVLFSRIDLLQIDYFIMRPKLPTTAFDFDDSSGRSPPSRICNKYIIYLRAYSKWTKNRNFRELVMKHQREPGKDGIAHVVTISSVLHNVQYEVGT